MARGFAASAAAGIAGALLLRRFWQSRWMRRVLLASDDSTSQLRVRGAFLILLLFPALALVLRPWSQAQEPSQT